MKHGEENNIISVASSFRILGDMLSGPNNRIKRLKIIIKKKKTLL
jgi:hypothetical protein